MLTRWSLDPGDSYLALAAALYLLGGRGRLRPSARQALCFAAGLLAIVLALNSPIDYYADELFWVHMLQHVVLLTVAPPLFLLGAPWPRMWRALPLRARATVGRALARSHLAAPLRAIARPLPALVLFNGNLIAWHIPAAYDLTLTNGAVHACEHALFFFTGLLFWARVIDPGPLRPRLVWPARIAYTVASMVVSWALAVWLVFDPHPLYGYYAALATRPGNITALGDQQLAGGVMWVPGSVAYTLTVLTGVHRWLAADYTTTTSPPAAIST